MDAIGRMAQLISLAVAYAEIGVAGWYGAAARIWSLVAGPVTLGLIAGTLSPEMQGYYFGFSGILALQVLAELGLGAVIVPIVSHEWARVHLDESRRVLGEPAAVARLASLARFVIVWYGAGGAMVAIVLAGAGYAFFSAAPATNVAWHGPWFALCLTAGVALLAQGLLYLLEGCQQLNAVYRCNFVSGVASAVGMWVVLLAGGGLWAAAVPGAVRAAAVAVFCVAGYRDFWRSLFRGNRHQGVDWRTEVWPFQWRIGVSWLAGYFINSIANPVVFRYEGAAVAGQVGMSLALAATVPWIGFALVKPQTASFGATIAQGDYATLDRDFRRVAIVSVSMAAALSVGVLALVIFLFQTRSPYSTRMLPPLESGLLLLTAVIRTILHLQSTYLRSHKAEPLMTASIAAGVIAAVVTVLATRSFGAPGMVTGYLLVTLLFELPLSTLIFVTKRQEWRTARRLECGAC